MLWKYFQNCIYSFRKKLGHKSDSLTYCCLLQPIVLHNFSGIESTIPESSWDYLVDCWWLCGMASICLIRKGKYDWFLYKVFLLDWQIFLCNYYNLSAVQKILPRQRILNLKSISSFPTSACLKSEFYIEHQNFCHCNAI